MERLVLNFLNIPCESGEGCLREKQKEQNPGLGIAQLVKCLLYRHEGPGSAPRVYVKSWCDSMHCNPGAGPCSGRDGWMLGAL